MESIDTYIEFGYNTEGQTTTVPGIRLYHGDKNPRVNRGHKTLYATSYPSASEVKFNNSRVWAQLSNHNQEKGHLRELPTIISRVDPDLIRKKRGGNEVTQFSLNINLEGPKIKGREKGVRINQTGD